VTGKLPRERQDLLDLAAHLDERPPPADAVLATVPRELAALLERALAPIAAERPALTALRDVLARLSRA
jgi:hypothetical protein